MTITKQTVADKIAAYLHHRITQAQLVDWAENALMEGEFAEEDTGTISAVVSRLGVADVRAFGLTWADCEQLLGQLGFAARVEIITALAFSARCYRPRIPPLASAGRCLIGAVFPAARPSLPVQE